jgi:hypothetical protein
MAFGNREPQKSPAGQNMRLFIAAIIAVVITGCAGGGLTGMQTASVGGPSGKTWTSDAFDSKGSE